MKTSLIATVLNEATHVAEFLNGVSANMDDLAEVIIVDGGSTDGTWQQLSDWAAAHPKAEIILRPDLNIAAGRNEAARWATGDILLATDAGCQLPERWAQAMTSVFADPDIVIAKGAYHGVGTSRVARAAASTLVNSPRSLAKRTALPSSRAVAFRAAAFRAVGGYPEDLTTAEDTVLARRLTGLGQMAFVRSPSVAWRMRETLSAVYRQYYRYSQGDRAAGTNTRLLARLATVWVALIAVSARSRRAGAALGVCYACRRISPRHLRNPTHMAASILVLVVSDWARLLGYLRGRPRG